MRYLLDTNAFIRFAYYDLATTPLSVPAEKAIRGSEVLYMSIVSLWEMAIKMKLGKLQIQSSMKQIEAFCREEGIVILPIRVSYLDETLMIPLKQSHKDPFDRLILATAMAERLPLISSDSQMQDYGVPVVW